VQIQSAAAAVVQRTAGGVPAPTDKINRGDCGRDERRHGGNEKGHETSQVPIARLCIEPKFCIEPN
jgi:hypothetical protein